MHSKSLSISKVCNHTAATQNNIQPVLMKQAKYLEELDILRSAEQHDLTRFTIRSPALDVKWNHIVVSHVFKRVGLKGVR